MLKLVTWTGEVWRGLSFVLACAGALDCALAATNPVQSIEPGFRVTSFQAEDGLPVSTITCLAQTGDGFLWLGTPKGLVRFDGVQFKVLVSIVPGALHDERISSLLADRSGALWIGTEGGDIVRFGTNGSRQALAGPGGGGERVASFIQARHVPAWQR